MDDAGIRILLYKNDDMMQTLAEYLSSGEKVPLDETAEIDMRIARMLPEKIARRLCVVAIGEADDRIILAMGNPLDVVAQDSVRLSLKREIKVALSSRKEIMAAIDAVYHGFELEEKRIRSLIEDEDDDVKVIDARLDDTLETGPEGELAANTGPVVQFVNLLFKEAVKKRASDIHIEPLEHSMNIRMRIDGMLQKMPPPARTMQAAVISRIKVLSRMNIAERRLPQDGRFKIGFEGRKIDVRVSTAPTKYGEKAVIRILDACAVNHELDEIGFDPELLEEFKQILAKPHGIIIVTGPTGSGKSTTLYSALNYLRDPRKNITTVEDPIEYSPKEINQMQVKPKIGLDFASCLRAILRQDPDIILIGEVRDKETADIAINASLTGHLVLTTFHTNDAPGAISRLIHMGVEPYLLASTLDLVIAQRLVRRVCENCREPVTLNEKALISLKIAPELVSNATVCGPRGCSKCGGTGYSGRLPIFEFLVIDNQMRQDITVGISEVQIRQSARERGYGGLLESGVSKMLQGLTTFEEVVRTTFAETGRIRQLDQSLLSESVVAAKALIQK
ncbi:MAG: GspE/PulE family protein [Planctomycetota bacterium]|jgi:type IV pilus assembly protein PilB